MAKKRTAETPMTRDEIEELIIAVIKRELSSLVGNLDTSPIERHKGTGSRVTKRTVSIPVDVWNQLRRECPGPASGHVTAAIKLYLLARKGGEVLTSACPLLSPHRVHAHLDWSSVPGPTATRIRSKILLKT